MRNAIFIIFILLLFQPTPARAGHRQGFDALSLYWENDAFAGTDRDYTNGVKLTWSTPYKTDQNDSHLPGWSYPAINWLPFVNDPEKDRAVSLSIGQDIFTPEDTERSDLVEDERPYAGIAYLAVGFHSKTDSKKDSWEFQTGIVGPHSYAEKFRIGVMT